MNKIYFCIDLKSFYAAVECVERGLDPMTTNLVVADKERSDKTICLAVSPSLRKLGVKNRCRVFEIPKNIDYIMATPQMQKYIDYSAEIYGIYLEYFSKEDIHVYSIDEVFIDVSPYLNLYKLSPIELAHFLIDQVKDRVGVNAACGIGTNLYLAKIALDIPAKHSDTGISFLDESLYQKTLWDHRPLTDFWRIGKGISDRLETIGIQTMRDIAYANEESLYDLFGIDAELLIDHAWGREPVEIKDIKLYKPKTNSLSNGQVLMRDYAFNEAQIIMEEMTEQMCLEMIKKKVVTESISIVVRYSRALDREPAKATVSLYQSTNSREVIIPEVLKAFRSQVDPEGKIRKITISCNRIKTDTGERQLSFFDKIQKREEKKDKDLQQSILKLKDKYGSNAILKGIDLDKAATTRERNNQIGGHKRG